MHGAPGLLQNDGVEGDHRGKTSHLHEVLLVHFLDVQAPGLEQLVGQVLPHVILHRHLEHEVGLGADLRQDGRMAIPHQQRRKADPVHCVSDLGQLSLTEVGHLEGRKRGKGRRRGMPKLRD